MYKFHILTITIASVLMTACGLSTDTTQYLSIQMYGVSEAPASAAGNASPVWQNYSLTKVDMMNADGSEATTLFDDAASPKTAKIVNRPQLIYQKDVTDLAGNDYSAIQLTFDTAVTGGSKNSSDHTFTLTTGVQTLTQNFTIEDGKDKTLTVQLRWLNTVQDTTMQEPEFSLTFDN